MREIKFRAWVNEDDPEYSRMVKSEQAITTILSHKYGGNGVARPAGFSDIDNQPKPERYILMQYTGLKDKNGKEIYEGDILHHPVQGKRKVYYPFDDRTACYGLEMVGGNIVMRSTLDNGFLYEVIGNIYENPELLEGEE